MTSLRRHRCASTLAVSAWIWLTLRLLLFGLTNVQGLLQTRLSTLEPWKTTKYPNPYPNPTTSTQKESEKKNDVDDDDTGEPPQAKQQPAMIIGWAREERDSEKQTYRVHLGLGDYHNSNNNNADKSNKNNENDPTPSSAISVSLPFMVEQNSLGSILWSSGLAAGILCQTPAMAALVQDKRVLELGAGLGLPGRVLSALAKQPQSQQQQQSQSQSQSQQGVRIGPSQVVLTDNDDTVLQQVKPLSSSSSSLHPEVLSTHHLEWRDVEVSSSFDAQKAHTTTTLVRQSFDVILGSDVAYYFFLLRPLMDTIQTFRKKMSHDNLVLILGQANRKSQWDLYRNIRKGCYNAKTDQHEGPWPGKTYMLLYKLRLQSWQDENDDGVITATDSNAATTTTTNSGSLPIAVLVHGAENHPQLQDTKTKGLFTTMDYIATKKDQDAMEMSF